MTTLRYCKTIATENMTREEMNDFLSGKIPFEEMAEKHPGPGFYIEEPPQVRVVTWMFKAPWGVVNVSDEDVYL